MKLSNTFLFVVPDDNCPCTVQQELGGLKVMVISASKAEECFSWACGIEFAQVNITTYINPQSAKYLMSRVRHSPYTVSIHNGNDTPREEYEEAFKWLEDKIDKLD